jgi:hypothetical protein
MKRTVLMMEVQIMKGYVVADGFMGFVEGVYELFATEQDYYEYMAA